MRSKLLFILTVCFIFSIFSFNALAQDEEKAQSFLVWDVVVKPGMANEYEAAVKKEIEIFKKHKFLYSMSGYSSSDFHYYFSIAIENHAGIDAIYTAIEKVANAASDEWQTMAESAYHTYEYMKPGVITFNPTLSYIPENLDSQEELNFRFWSHFYVKPGKPSEFEEIMKKWVAMYKEKKISTGYNSYIGGIGTDQPYYFVAGSAKSAVESFSQGEKSNKILGEDGEKLWQKTLSLLRKLEDNMGSYRPDLSYILEK